MWLKSNYQIIGILLFAAILRLWGLNYLPIELFGDELDAGYQAYSLLKTGQDYTGHLLPVYLQSFSEYRAPLFIYSMIPAVGLFGLSEIGVRLTPASWGLVNILLLYLLTSRLFNKKIALTSALILSLTPWHIHYSRAAFEVTMLLSFILYGILCWLKSQESKKWLYLSLLIFSLTPLIYSAATAFVPLIVLALWWIFPVKKIDKPSLLIALTIVVVFGGFFLQRWLGGQLNSRLTATSIINNSATLDGIYLKQKADSANWQKRLFHNKVLTFAQEASKNYLTAISPQFLALDGDPNPAHSAVGGGFGQLWHIQYLLVFVGVIVLLKNWRQPGNRLMVIWLILAPLPSAVTIGGGYHATRLFLMLVPITVATTLGFWFLIEKFRSQPSGIVGLGVISVVIIEALLYSHHLVNHYRLESWAAWQFGYRQAIEQLPFGQPTVISYSGEPALIRYLFYKKVDPQWLHANFTGDQLIPNILPGLTGFRLGNNLYFGQLTSGTTLEQFLKPGMSFLAVQGRDVPGDWDWSISPPAGVSAQVIREPLHSKAILVVGRKD